MIVAALVGLNARSTMDMDATVKDMQVDVENTSNAMVGILSLSTEDIITPREIRYRFNMIFEDRFIEIWTYNLEAV